MSTSTPLKFHSFIWWKKIDLPIVSCCHSWNIDRIQIPWSVSALYFYLVQTSFKWQVLHWLSLPKCWSSLQWLPVPILNSLVEELPVIKIKE